MTNESNKNEETVVEATNVEPKKSVVKEKFVKAKNWISEHKGTILKNAALLGLGGLAVGIASYASKANNETTEFTIREESDENGVRYSDPVQLDDGTWLQLTQHDAKPETEVESSEETEATENTEE